MESVHQIKNKLLTVGIKTTGAELCSIKNNKTGKEYIWQADPDIWASHAPNLFPVIGLLKDGVYFYDGTKYEMPKHGFVRHNGNLEVAQEAQDTITFELKFSEESLKIYPFKFLFEINFSLLGKTLTVSHQIKNQDNKPLYFSLGGHPAFNAPLYKGEEYEDYYLQFDRKQDLKTHLLNSEKLVSKETSVVTQSDDKINLHKKLFDNDALIFKDILSKKVSLKSKKSGAILTVEYKDFKNLGIWAKPAAPYVCIEPWLGIADVEGTNQDLKIKEGIIELMPSKEFNASYTISIEN
ncbi:aldose 1-epimerase family protein [Salinimicrobium sp. GXAS 041]|uniref:aldose 1-epimerase family protein n=1 Tax=Salinimicrobium sp. GXAS 041 TaxID=3400806 RepID=UPI003C739893